MEKLLQKARHLVDVRKDDGFAAVHLASLNGYKAITKILIIKGHSDINLRNMRDQTPLHLATSQVGKLNISGLGIKPEWAERTQAIMRIFQI